VRVVRWEPGGDVRLLTLDGLHKGAGAALAWSTPRTLLEERTDAVPKVRLGITARVTPVAEVHLGRGCSRVVAARPSPCGSE
jgi:hypothetical protein